MHSEYRAGLVAKIASVGSEVCSVDACTFGNAELDEAAQLVGDAHLLKLSRVTCSSLDKGNGLLRTSYEVR